MIAALSAVLVTAFSFLRGLLRAYFHGACVCSVSNTSVVWTAGSTHVGSKNPPWFRGQDQLVALVRTARVTLYDGLR